MDNAAIDADLEKELQTQFESTIPVAGREIAVAEKLRGVNNAPEAQNGRIAQSFGALVKKTQLAIEKEEASVVVDIERCVKDFDARIKEVEANQKDISYTFHSLVDRLQDLRKDYAEGKLSIEQLKKRKDLAVFDIEMEGERNVADLVARKEAFEHAAAGLVKAGIN